MQMQLRLVEYKFTSAKWKDFRQVLYNWMVSHTNA